MSKTKEMTIYRISDFTKKAKVQIPFSYAYRLKVPGGYRLNITSVLGQVNANIQHWANGSLFEVFSEDVLSVEEGLEKINEYMGKLKHE